MSRIDKPRTQHQNTDKSRLLEQLDEDIQELNQLKQKIKQLEEEKQLKEQQLEQLDTTSAQVPSVMFNTTYREYRQYDLAYNRVKEFYKEQHRYQTVAYNIQARINFKTKVRDKMTIWDALLKLNHLLDESDPDTELSQIEHAFQTAEAIRKDNKPRWFQLVGLIHDLGKLLYFYESKGQWDVVGDTFPVGCRYSTKIIHHEFFKDNPDYKNPLYNTKYGIYSPHCGLENVMLSWGHDEYMYHLAKEQSRLPPQALAMIRYHSFYPWHQEGAYKYLMNKKDEEMLKAVKEFNPYDLYSKTDVKCNLEEVKDYYIELIDEFFPKKVIDF
ncbi:hypothetical protein OGAPHI_000208 [Ogataea philodendri]|uniref:Inositol oxygenase n=1 Tax=Ogataea philodendri TaxID=1378263 RepID=A0A9P8PH09_9ASCO|nr:uncharacterized protein OGAPHI_000208 [Ogataea philodendri]KAH3671505.1 hypothetical protein OGAPHI_000208 [Ogataea philodendri]